MRASHLTSLLLLAGCSAMSGDRSGSSPHEREIARSSPPYQSLRSDTAHGPFTGVWQLCDEGAAPGQCGEYRLVQVLDRICGTWSYVATSAGYEGRLIGRSISGTEARRMRVCGRPGSETRTECDDGWEDIDKPLRICRGKLVESDTEDRECRAAFTRARDADAQLRVLAQEPWMQACLVESASKAAR